MISIALDKGEGRLEDFEQKSELEAENVVNKIVTIRDDNVHKLNQADQPEPPTKIKQTEDSIDAGSVNERYSFSVAGTSNSECTKPVFRRRRRRQEDGYLQDLYLPPCRICGDLSSGFHYGANTCEACKGFFRRTLKRENKTYRCKCMSSEKQNRKQGHVTNGCAACRYKQCMAVGMSKEAIKIGRYTSVHRTQNITEIKSQTVSRSQDDFKVESTKDSESSSPGSIVDTMYLGPCLSSPEENLKCSQHPPLLDIGSSESLQVELSSKEMDELICQLHDAHNSTLFRRDNVSKETVQKNHEEYLEVLRLKKEVFGELKALSKEEYLGFYNSTGIDIDGRYKNFRNFIDDFQNKIKHIIRFSKSIPGFKDLAQTDQINLIKYSRAETFIVSGYRNICKHVNMDLGVFTTPWDSLSHFAEGKNIYPMKLMRKKVEYAHRLNNLGLDDKEQALLRAIVMTFPDRCELEDPDTVQRIQDRLIACLQHTLRTRPTGSGSLFYKISDILISFRDFTEIDNTVTKDLLFEYKTEDNVEWANEVVL